MNRVRSTALALFAAVLVVGLVPVVAKADVDSFFRYAGSKPLSAYTPGEVLKTRTRQYHLLGVPTPLQAVQVLYRTTDAQGRPSANVTSVLKHPGKRIRGVVSYQSAYDSLNPQDSPSRAVAGDFRMFGLTPQGRNIHVGNVMANMEDAIMPAVLALGYAVNIPDTEGQEAHFAAGPEYGTNTLDSLRAISSVRSTGVGHKSKIGLVGYSGGAIASNWAAILAPKYAPEINRRIAGVSQGGLLVNPYRNLRYVSGSYGWGGVIGMAINGVGRAYGIDFDKYTTPYGKQVLRQLSDASILNFWYPGLTWRKLVKPQYFNPASVPPFVEAVNKLNMGTAPVPTAPMFIAQSDNGVLEGTLPGPPGIGLGDGVMITGDVRALARRYCRAGTSVEYHQYPLSHTTGPNLWGIETVVWLLDRMSGKRVPSNCGQIPRGNPDALKPLQHAR
ncbi:lipase family protein [Gordonia sp. HY002]|uniref:lipase family protein n=1 Tax=Gordonia zhenghanii TaxID=2911516 RepID=UPI001EF0CEA4|nr:lipase family protein [Gordonia zhenghanii]MCF8572120.1 lipase family protein [Gordonia zhenghanii]MCF8604296.1 lipase family protein [Gordonia zhenghanii]